MFKTEANKWSHVQIEEKKKNIKKEIYVFTPLFLMSSMGHEHNF